MDARTEFRGQWLFRAEVSGDEGSASLRLLLRRYAAQRFSLAAADAMGQTRWEIRSDGARAIWLDTQRHRYCNLDPRLPLRANQWVPNIALSNLPGLLIGEWPPAGPDTSVPDAGSALQSTAPRITGERDDSGWVAWTLWEDGAPAVWWKRLGSEALLSVRRPSVQVRWRLAARVDLAAPSDPATASPEPFSGDLPTDAGEFSCPGNAIP